MTVKIEKVSFRGWKNCVKIADEKAEAIVSADFGPRIQFKTVCAITFPYAATSIGALWTILSGRKAIP